MAFIAFVEHKQHSLIKHGLIPMAGLVANVAMLVAIFYLGIMGGGDARTAALIAIGGAVLWSAGGCSAAGS